jgi:hypothetical protein
MTTMVPVKLAKECNCDFDQDPAVHDRLLGIEEMSAVEAATFIAEIIGNEGNGGSVSGEAYLSERGLVLDEGKPLFDDPHDFGRFVASHNWRDPAAMATLAVVVNDAVEEAWLGRISRQRSGAVA